MIEEIARLTRELDEARAELLAAGEQIRTLRKHGETIVERLEAEIARLTQERDNVRADLFEANRLATAYRRERDEARASAAISTGEAERERDAAIVRADQWQHEAYQMLLDRDEARALADSTISKLTGSGLLREKAEGERDEAQTLAKQNEAAWRMACERADNAERELAAARSAQ